MRRSTRRRQLRRLDQALFGLDGDTRALTAGVRRKIAAETLGVSLKTFLRKHEEPMRSTDRPSRSSCSAPSSDSARGAIELAAAHPVESGMAVHWIERFQAYYRTLVADLRPRR